MARSQIARVLVRSLQLDAATRKTFELIAERGREQANLDALFAALDPDPDGALDGVHDMANMPIEEEPPAIQAALLSANS